MFSKKSHNANCLLQPGSDPIEATFELNDTLFAKAHVPPTEEVYLWLGVCSTDTPVIARIRRALQIF